jgi:hypothetical protein
VGDEFIDETGKQLVQNLRTTGREGVDLAALPYASPVQWIGRQQIAFDHGNGSVEVGKHPRGQQSAHAGAENYRLPICTRCDLTGVTHTARRPWIDHVSVAGACAVVDHDDLLDSE